LRFGHRDCFFGGFRPAAIARMNGAHFSLMRLTFAARDVSN